MKLSKKLFLLAVLIFFLVMIYISYDISRRTTFPGSKPQLKERILENDSKKDSAELDSIGQN